MNAKHWCLTLVTLTLGVPAGAGQPIARDAHALVARTLAGLAAGRAIDTVRGVEIEATEIDQDLVENDHPLTPPFNIAKAAPIRRTDDFDRGIERTVSLGGAPGTAVTTSATLRITSTNSGSSASRSVASAPPVWWIHDPIVALRHARDARDLSFDDDRVVHGARQQVVTFHEGRFRIRLAIDAATGLPGAIESTVTFDDRHLAEAIAWNALGDVTERTEFLNWSVSDGVRYPLQFDTMRNGQLFRTILIKSVHWNVPVDTQELTLRPGESFSPASVQDYRPDQKVPGPYPGKPIETIAPGIVQIPNSWYSTIVRQDDGLVIIDAPISAGYAKGIIDEAARRFPGVPIKALVTSTGFFWHVAGVREFAAKGIPIYAEARNVPVIRKMLASPHTLSPDDLATLPHRTPVVIPVSDRLVIGHGRNAIALYPVRAATQPMVMSYIADANLVHTAEMVQPLGPGGSILFPESLIELIHSVRAAKLEVRDMIGMHMSPTPWSAVARTLDAAGVADVSLARSEGESLAPSGHRSPAASR